MKILRTRVLLLVLPALTTACAVAPDRNDAAASFAELDVAAVAAAVSPPKIADGVGKSYTIVKAGSFFPSGDIADLDDGIFGELIFGRALLPFLAVEGSLGYLAADGRFGASQFDLWAIPAFVNVRASVPVLFFEPYAGVGVGGMYADYSAGSFFSTSDFVAAWDAFVGLEFGVGRLAIGAEYKYVQSDDTKNGFAIEGSTASLFVSIPF